MESADFENMRRAMVDGQLRTSGVTEPWVLAAMGSAAREKHVPAPLRAAAYMDRAIPLGGGKMLNPPVAIALMLQAAMVDPADRTLLIGAEDGYVAELLSRRVKKLVVAGTLSNLPTAARPGSFSLIIIDGAIEELPDALLALAADNARIVTGLLHEGVASLATGYVRGGKVVLRTFADSEIAALPEFARKREFVF